MQLIVMPQVCLNLCHSAATVLDMLIHTGSRQDPPPRRGGRAQAPHPDRPAHSSRLTPHPRVPLGACAFSSGSWELYAETFGAAADPAVVLLHGAGNSMMAWDAELCEAIAARGRLVVRLDARDAGRSAGSGDAGRYSLHDMAGDVVALLDALELPAATLAGVSQGGIDRADRRGRAPGRGSAGSC